MSRWTPALGAPIISQNAQPGFAFNNAALGNNPANNTSAVGAQGLSNFALGRVNNDLGYGGLVLSAGSESVSVLIRALAAQRKIHVLSRPQIRTLDNQPALRLYHGLGFERRPESLSILELDRRR